MPIATLYSDGGEKDMHMFNTASKSVKPNWAPTNSLLNQLGLHNHPVRLFLQKSITPHIIPDVVGPCHILHITTLPSEKGFRSEGFRLIDFAQYHGHPLLVKAPDRIHMQWEKGELIWHADPLFSYTFILKSDQDLFFNPDSLENLPVSLLEGVPGAVLSAIRLCVLTPRADVAIYDEIQDQMEDDIGIASDILHQSASLWIAQKTNADGFLRAVIGPHHSDPSVIGKTIDTLFQAEAARNFTTTGIPIHENHVAQTTRVKCELRPMLDRLSLSHGEKHLKADLIVLTDIVQDMEKESLSTAKGHAEFTSGLPALSDALQNWSEEGRYGAMTYTNFFKSNTKPLSDAWINLRQEQATLATHVERSIHLINARLLALVSSPAPENKEKSPIILPSWLQITSVLLGLTTLVALVTHIFW